MNEVMADILTIFKTYINSETLGPLENGKQGTEGLGYILRCKEKIVGLLHIGYCNYWIQYITFVRNDLYDVIFYNIFKKRLNAIDNTGTFINTKKRVLRMHFLFHERD